MPSRTVSLLPSQPVAQLLSLDTDIVHTSTIALVAYVQPDSDRIVIGGITEDVCVYASDAIAERHPTYALPTGQDTTTSVAPLTWHDSRVWQLLCRVRPLLACLSHS